MSKIKEKKLHSIKSEMEEIKNFIVSNNDLGNSKENKTDYLNNKDQDTITLTKIVNNENNLHYNNDLDQIKKQLSQLKDAIYTNNNLLNEILLKIK